MISYLLFNFYPVFSFDSASLESQSELEATWSFQYSEQNSPLLASPAPINPYPVAIGSN